MLEALPAGYKGLPYRGGGGPYVQGSLSFWHVRSSTELHLYNFLGVV